MDLETVVNLTVDMKRPLVIYEELRLSISAHMNLWKDFITQKSICKEVIVPTVDSFHK